MGNRRQPNELKRAKGTLNVTRDKDSLEIRRDEKFITIPQCPDYFSEFAAYEWQTVWSFLISYQLATTVDLSLIVAYCVEMGKYRDCVSRIGNNFTIINPKGYEVENPLNAVANKSLSNAMKIAGEFGFTPVSRSRIQMIKAEKQSDPFEDLLD